MVKYIVTCADKCRCNPDWKCECECSPEEHLVLEYDTLEEAEECSRFAVSKYDAPCVITTLDHHGNIKVVRHCAGGLAV
jgi:hypothetical protein